MLDLIGRAIHHEPLTAAQRALLKLLQGFLFTGLVAVFGLLADVFSGNNPIVLSTVALLVAGVFLSSVMHAIAKYLSARGDPQLAALGDVVEGLADQIDAKLNIPSNDAAAQTTVAAAGISRSYVPKASAALLAAQAAQAQYQGEAAPSGDSAAAVAQEPAS